MSPLAQVPARSSAQDRVLHGDARGASGAVVGVAGTGKTRLLDAVVAAVEAKGIGVVRVSGQRSLADAPLAALRELGGDGQVSDPATGTAWLLTKLGQPPWLLAVDDAHLLDQQSLAAVAGVARRAQLLGGGVISTYRPVRGLRAPDPALTAGKEPIVLGPLTAAQVASLPAVGGNPARAAAIVAATGGNPRLATILAGSDQPLPPAAVDVVRAELEALPAEARRLALAMAAGEPVNARGAASATLITAGLAGSDGQLLPLARAALASLTGGIGGTPPVAAVRAGCDDETTDGLLADRAWRNGETTLAIEAADRALAAGHDPDFLAAGVAAAAAAADGALFESAERWRGIAAALAGVPGSWAAGRAALAAGLAGDVQAAAMDVLEARQLLPGSAPRGLTVLLDGVEATLHAVAGGFDHSGRRLAGLAVANVPTDPLVAERWDDLAVAVVIAGGEDRTAREMLAAHGGRQPGTRRRLLAAWLDLRAGRLAESRRELAAASGVPTLRLDAALAAAIAVGLAWRAGDLDALRATWHRVAPVVAGTDVELLLLDAWGELSVGAAQVAPMEADRIVEAMAAAAARAGNPTWCLASQQWWRLQRAVVTEDAVTGSDAAEQLAALAAVDGRVRLRAAAALAWASILAGRIDPTSIIGTAEQLAEAGQLWEAAALCGRAAGRLADQSVASKLNSLGRAFRAKVTPGDRANAGGLSERERAVGELLVDGLTQKEIGARLYISPKTVEQHVANLRQKLMVSNRSELIAALRARLGQ